MSRKLHRRRKRRKGRKAQTNDLFKDFARRKLEHKGTNGVMDNATQQVLWSQGTLESEITFEGEAGLIKNISTCPKREKHEQFILATAFAMKHLPCQYQDQVVFDCVKELMTLCVCIKVTRTNKIITQKSPFSLMYVSEHQRFGSGSAFLPKEEERRNGECCPCDGGRGSANPCTRTEWYSVLVSTALHVIYDDLEASKTLVGWQFNDDASKDRITWMQGIRLVDVDVENDRCILECVTHDVGIRDCIENSMLRLRQKEEELHERYVQRILDNGQPVLAVIVSHPHGGAMKVSLGTDVVRRHIKDDSPGIEWTEYRYDAPTCSGSSGALVWLPGQMRLGIQDKTITVHTHSGQCDDTLNMSGGGLDFVTDHTTGDCPPSNSGLITPLQTSRECHTHTERSDIL